MSSTSESPRSEVVIRVDGLTIGHGEQVLLQDASFEVRRGEVFVVLGGSGCGKSTLLRHLIGLQQPMRGAIHIAGIGDPQHARGRPGMGVMFQSGALFGSMTLGQNVALPLETWTDLEPDAVAAVVRSKLELVGLGGSEDQLPADLSGGMRKRAGIARALALDPPLLLLDEPSAGLDPVTAAGLDELILTLSRSLGMTLVVVTHELASIFTIATTCIMLDRSSRSIVARGDPRQLREHSDDPRVLGFFNRIPAGG
jgi:phospholipid/cholesterol/gamma-HCH transport system ATP-binding protein